MLVDAMLNTAAGATVRQYAEIVEGAGFDALWVTEAGHDPFLLSLEVARATSRIQSGTSIAVAFGRSPMTVATSAYDLAHYSDGRFVLGLGSQIKAHIERRYGMPWSSPARRMREYVGALRAIWASWQEDQPLDFQGEFYTHTLMPPFFKPPRHRFGAPPVYLAAVGELMTEVAGEACDGLIFHPFTTRSYLSNVTRAAVLRGRERAGQTDLDGFTISGSTLVCTAEDQAGLDVAVAATKKQIAFYASTPAYRTVLEHEGLADLQPELLQLSKAGRWDEMANLVDDDVLNTFAVVAPMSSVQKALNVRWGGVADRITLYAPYVSGPEFWARILAA